MAEFEPADLGDNVDRENMEMDPVSSTTRIIELDDEEEEETSFGGVGAYEYDARMKDQDYAEKEIKKYYPRADTSKFITFLKDIGKGIKVPTISLNRRGAAEYVLIDGEFKNFKTKSKKLPDKLKNALGPRAEEIVEDNDREITKIKESQNKKKEERKFLVDKQMKTPEESSRIEVLDREISEDDNKIANRERENEQIQERMSLRDRVKVIFKKYGFTVFAVVSAVGVVIGVIVSNLSKGLTTLGKGVGNGFKAIGKKLGEILPGMVGAIVSFLFKTAGEVISFLGKNAWLLIMVVVLYFVEQFKKKRN